MVAPVSGSATGRPDGPRHAAVAGSGTGAESREQRRTVGEAGGGSTGAVGERQRPGRPAAPERPWPDPQPAPRLQLVQPGRRRCAAAIRLRLALQYAVADTYFGWQADQARLQLADRLLATQRQFVQIAELRVKQGVDLPDEAQKARAQLAAVREMRVALDGSAKIRRVSLASLLGLSPDQLPELKPHALPTVSGGV